MRRVGPDGFVRGTTASEARSRSGQRERGRLTEAVPIGGLRIETGSIDVGSPECGDVDRSRLFRKQPQQAMSELLQPQQGHVRTRAGRSDANRVDEDTTGTAAAASARINPVYV